MIAKFNYVRSAKLMRAYRVISCQSCGAMDGTVCGAHSNQSIHGKGRSIKASDEFCASLCARCHAMLDHGKDLSREEKESMWNQAHEKTKAELTRLGLYVWH